MAHASDLVFDSSDRSPVAKASGVNWRQVGLFVGLTIALSWLLDLFLWLRFGYTEYANLFFQLQMLIPAAVAIFLQRYIFKDSPIFFRRFQERPRWFFIFFLLFTLVFVGLVGLVSVRPALYPLPLASVVGLLSIFSVIVLVVVRLASGRDAMARAGLQGGRWSAWPLVWLAIVAFLAIQVGLNWAFDLGATANVGEAAAAAGMGSTAFFAATLTSMVIANPLIGLVIAFGEEYGWRGYLQSELIKLGRLKGVLLVGLIWGIWHAPAVAMGHNYPGYPIAGPIAFLVFNLILAIFLGYVVFKTGSVWLAAFAHALLNTTYSWLVTYVYTPDDPLFSFGVGIYGILFAAAVALLILRDPVWRRPVA